MKELKAKAKVTQAMTRDGLTLENQATGEVENISSREAEQDLSAPGPGGTADKLLERADAIHDGHKAKKAAKQAGAVAAEGDRCPAPAIRPAPTVGGRTGRPGFTALYPKIGQTGR
ncbi:hypothetical protein EfmAA96_32560 (plasmid) [Enterococcus faecium]|nr:hypothetical protein EfmAA96_32560 [Enterococcus faecium]